MHLLVTLFLLYEIYILETQNGFDSKVSPLKKVQPL